MQFTLGDTITTLVTAVDGIDAVTFRAGETLPEDPAAAREAMALRILMSPNTFLYGSYVDCMMQDAYISIRITQTGKYVKSINQSVLLREANPVPIL